MLGGQADLGINFFMLQQFPDNGRILMASGLVPNIVITFNISLISLDSGRPDLFQCRLFFRPFRLGFFTLFFLFLLHFHLVRGRNDFLHDRVSLPRG